MQVYHRLHRMNLTVSHASLIHLLERVGKGHDSRVKEWKDAVTAKLDDTDENVCAHIYSCLAIHTGAILLFLSC